MYDPFAKVPANISDESKQASHRATCIKQAQQSINAAVEILNQSPPAVPGYDIALQHLDTALTYLKML